MPWIDDWDYGASEDPAYRRHVVSKELARLNTAPPPDSPAESERRKQADAERLKRHDELFGLSGWGSGLARHVSAGTPEDRDD